MSRLDDAYEEARSAMRAGHALTQDDVTFGRYAYLDIADELSGDERFLDDVDPQWERAARRFAEDLGVSWPPVADIDQALEVVRAAERRQST